MDVLAAVRALNLRQATMGIWSGMTKKQKSDLPIYIVSGLLVAALAFDFIDLDTIPSGVLIVIVLAITLLSVAGAVASFPTALDLSTAMFSTLGYDGREGLSPSWRLLSALEGINGFLPIGWSTAYLVGVATRHGPFGRQQHF